MTTPRQRLAGLLAFLILGSVMLVAPFFIPDAEAAPHMSDEVRAALTHASREWNVNYSKMAQVSKCESTWNPNASNRGRYLGLFQHKSSSWQGRVKSFNDHVRLHNSRHPNQQLSVMSGTWNAAIDNARVTAAMVAGVLPGSRGWGPWSCA